MGDVEDYKGDAEDYKPPAEFQENTTKDPFMEIHLTDSTELWLIQWPNKEPLDIDGQEVSLKLHHDGQLGSFESSSGKSYAMVNYAAQEPDASVFLSSGSETKFVGKISRRVCLVRYPEASELEKEANLKRPGRMNNRYGGASSSLLTPTQGSRKRSSRSLSGISHGSMMGPSRSSMQRSSLFDSGEPSSKPPRNRHVDEPPRSISRSYQDSEGRRSDVTSLGSAGTSPSEKSKRKNNVTSLGSAGTSSSEKSKRKIKEGVA